MSRTFFQYCCRVNVLVATALSPCFRRRLTTFAASADDRNNPYSGDPEPDSEAYFEPARSSAPFMSGNWGYVGRTTLSKSFSIPVRTRSRGNCSARLPPFAEAPVLGELLMLVELLSHAEIAQPTSNSLSEPAGRVNCCPPEWGRFVAGMFVDGRVSSRACPERSRGATAEPSSAPLCTSASQSANARSVETPTSGVTTTIATEGKSATG